MTAVVKRLLHTISKDILVVGGGPAGLSVVTAIQNSPKLQHLDVGCVDAQPLASKLSNWTTRHSDSVPLQNRIISLTPNSVEFLNRIGAWSNVGSSRTFTYDEMRVWDGVSGSAIEFDGYKNPSNSIATMIETENVQQSLFNTGRTSSSVTHAKILNIERNEIGWPKLTLDNDTAIEARLLVGADGQRSRVRDFAGIEYFGCDYHQHGVVATLNLEYDDFKSRAYQRFLPTGPLAILPMPDGHATLVWSTSTKRAEFLKNLDTNVFPHVVNAGLRLEMPDLDYIFNLNPENGDEILDEINWRFDQLQLGGEENLPAMIESAHSVASFPLRLRNAASYIGDRVALVGDAAHATHPLTGQGLNMGQRDVQYLLKAIELAYDRGLDLGSQNALEPYAKEAMPYDQAMLNVNDSLVKLYSTDFWPVVALRSAGLSFVDKLDFFKEFLMRKIE